ncbi:hypothetical protein OAC90_00220 [Planktomarina sp.]|nr:hypothetical protein [Planktomarina sp.]
MKIPLNKLVNSILSEDQLSDKTKKLVSLTFLLVAFSISMASYTHDGWFFDTQKNLRPDLPAILLGLALVTPLYARRILKWSASIYGIVTFILFLSVFASFLQIGLDGGGSDISKYLIGTAVIVSWIGIRGLAGIAWIPAIAAAGYNAISMSDTLGLWGAVFLVSVVIGLLLHSNLSPANLMQSLQDEFMPAATAKTENIRKDVKDLF